MAGASLPSEGHKGYCRARHSTCKLGMRCNRKQPICADKTSVTGPVSGDLVSGCVATSSWWDGTTVHGLSVGQAVQGVQLVRKHAAAEAGHRSTTEQCTAMHGGRCAQRWLRPLYCHLVTLQALFALKHTKAYLWGCRLAVASACSSACASSGLVCWLLHHWLFQLWGGAAVPGCARQLALLAACPIVTPQVRSRCRGGRRKEGRVHRRRGDAV